MTKANTYILDDQPTDKDGLDFKPYVRTLVDVCQTASTPLTIGIFGKWGSGKTSLMKMIKAGLPPGYTVAWFDAWKYDKEETLWRAFLLSALMAVEEKSGETEELERLKSKLYRGLELEKAGGVTIDLAKLGAKVGAGVAQIALSFIPPLGQLVKLVEELQKGAADSWSSGAADAIRRERTKVYIEQVRSLEQFQKEFRNLIAEKVQPSGRLVVFVDDLDRCLPEKAIEVLEAIKLFADAPQCVFVLGIDHSVIARGVEIRYGELAKDSRGGEPKSIDGERYLEKIIQLPFAIPPVERDDMKDFIGGLAQRWPHKGCPAVFAEGLGNNPRQIKRAVNVFLMLWKLSKERKSLKGAVKPLRLAKVVVIQSVHRPLYDLLAEQPGLLRDIELYCRQESAAKEAGAAEKEAAGRSQLSEDLLRLISGAPAVKRILIMHAKDEPDAGFWDQNTEDIRLYFTLTKRAETPPGGEREQPARVFEPQMARIPAGEFLMGSTSQQAAQAIKDGADKEWVKWEQPQRRVRLSEYFIGRYPLTNREYQFFIRATGRAAPQGWIGDQFPEGKGDHPVVNVSWEDAAAYCAWLSGETGKNYRLPTEAEWEKAARGTDGRVYPWGNEFDPEKANTSESGIGDTSAVGRFSLQGDSPYGCADMSGNVWEWCQDWFDEKAYQKRANQLVKDPTGSEEGGLRARRGGSFSNDRRLARRAYRVRNLPYYFYWDLGFRVVRSPILPLNSESLNQNLQEEDD